METIIQNRGFRDRDSGWTVRADGQYHLYQIPFRALEHDNESLPFGQLAYALGRYIVDGSWPDGKSTSIDEVRVHW